MRACDVGVWWLLLLCCGGFGFLKIVGRRDGASSSTVGTAGVAAVGATPAVQQDMVSVDENGVEDEMQDDGSASAGPNREKLL